jgi:hypothetical protein
MVEATPACEAFHARSLECMESMRVLTLSVAGILLACDALAWWRARADARSVLSLSLRRKRGR